MKRVTQVLINVGDRFGDWEIIDRVVRVPMPNAAEWNCKCGLCGSLKPVRQSNLLSGKSTKCNQCKAGFNQAGQSVVVEGITYRSIRQAAETLGISAYYVRKTVASDKAQQVKSI